MKSNMVWVWGITPPQSTGHAWCAYGLTDDFQNAPTPPPVGPLIYIWESEALSGLSQQSQITTCKWNLDLQACFVWPVRML